jgi:nucleotide-binding universal stress UspA family protein
MKILICSDGSEQAERAVETGAAIAVGCQAEVTLLGIIENAGHSDKILASLKRGQAALADKRVPAELISKAGRPVAEIMKRTKQTLYDLVVIGTVQKSAQGPFWMSSKSYKIIKEIEPPVLSVAGKARPIRKILICSGGKAYIDTGVALAGRVAQGLGASAVLLHVLPEPPAMYSGLRRMAPDPKELLNSHSELGLNLRREKETLESFNVPTQVRLRDGPVLDEILREFHEGGYDLIVTGSAPSHQLRSYILGDVTREIVNRVNGPVLIARSEPMSPAQGKAPRRWWRRNHSKP